MYHQVRVNSDDADALRFLWLENVGSDEKPDTCQMLVHIFGGKDSPSCANYAVRRTALDHGSKFDAAIAETEKQAVSIIKQLMIGGFKFTKFQSNNKEVIDSLPAQNVSQSTVTFNKDGGNNQ